MSRSSMNLSAKEMAGVDALNRQEEKSNKKPI
jgi:hypothetical protein